MPSGRAQPIAYGHTLGDSNWQNGYAIDADGAGNVYVFGQTTPSNGSAASLLLAKFDPTGVALWQRALALNASMTPIDLVTGASGDAYFDAVATPAGGPQFGVLGRFSPNGSLGFVEQFPMTPNGLAWNPVNGSVVVTADGVAGYDNGCVASFAPSGSLQWMRSVTPGQSASPWGAAVSAAGNIYVTVDRVAAGEAGLAEFSGSGTLLAQRRLDGIGSDAYTWDVGVSPAGTVLFAGYAPGLSLPVVAGFNATLAPRWSAFVNGTALYQEFFRVAAHPDGSVYAVGAYYNYSDYDQGSAVLRITGNGSLVSDDTYEAFVTTGNFRFVDSAVQTDGSLLLAGWSSGSPGRDEHSEGAVRLSATPGTWIADNAVWSANTTVPAAVSVSVSDPAFQVDDFSVGASSQLWWGAIGTPAASLNVGLTAAVPQAASLNRTVNFTSLVSGGSGLYTYRWSFGDGLFGTAADPVHTYAQGGVYPVQLWVNDSLGNMGYNFTQISLFAPPDITSFYAWPNVTYVNNWVNFYASATDPSGGYITNYHWDFGDNTSTDTSYGYTYHWYYRIGTFTANLTVSDSEGLSASETIQVRVLDAPPNPCLQLSPNPTLVGINVSYYSCSWDPDGYISLYAWDFGDGTTVAGANATGGVHVYHAAGFYHVSLNVTDNGGISATANWSETVYVNQPPVASFTVHVIAPANASPVDPGPNQTVQFDGSGSHARNTGSSLVEWYWDFGDGNTTWQFWWPYVYHAYSVAGRTYRVSLTVYDSYGVGNTTARSLYVDVPPVAAITTPRSVAKVGTPFVVNGSASRDADGSVRRWAWDFGDGATASGGMTSHVYVSTGIYTVTLQVFDNDNLTATTRLAVSVVEPKTPTAVLSYSPSRPTVGDAVAFNATLSLDPDGQILTYTWQFGDGAVGSGVEAMHAYTAPGTYTVILTVVDEDSMTASTTTTIEVVSRPTAAFVMYPSSPQTGDAVSFSAQGSSDLSGTLTYTWSFGDGAYGTGWQVSHAYAQAGSYTVTLTVTNAYGVSASTTQTVVISPAGLGAAAASGIGWLGLGIVAGVCAAALAVYLLGRRRKRGTPPPAP